MKKLLTTTVLAAPLVFGTAFAQSTDSEVPANTDRDVPTETRSADPAAPKTGQMGSPSQGVMGLSVKKNIIGQNVYNGSDDKIGEISDVILDDNGEATEFVVGVGGFLGLGEHDVAIPFDEIQQGDDHYTLQGYTKDELKELPKVEVHKYK